jgi:hypothetical protein
MREHHCADTWGVRELKRRAVEAHDTHVPWRLHRGDTQRRAHDRRRRDVHHRVRRLHGARPPQRRCQSADLRRLRTDLRRPAPKQRGRLRDPAVLRTAAPTLTWCVWPPGPQVPRSLSATRTEGGSLRFWNSAWPVSSSPLNASSRTCICSRAECPSSVATLKPYLPLSERVEPWEAPLPSDGLCACH